MTDIRLAFPYALILLLPLIWLLWRALSTDGLNRLSVLRYSDTRLLRGLPTTWRLRLRRLPALMQGIGYILLVIALARPQTGTERLDSSVRGIDLVIALDISDSMGRSDLDGLTRLDAAKNVTASFATDRPNDRLGLVVFAEQAYFLSPPTLDHNFFNRVLSAVTYASTLQISNRTAIGQGITAAASLLANSTAASRVVLVITDGANNAGTVDPVTAAQAANALGIRVYTLGMGQTGADSDLDEPMLQRVAATASGRYFNALNQDDLTMIYDTIDTLERSAFERDFTLEWQDQAFLLMLGALTVLAMGKFLERTLFQTIP